MDNLTSIVADGFVFSDAKRIADRKVNTNIGMTKLKQRRLAMPVTCHPNDCVGQYVPFNFCPRSVMLFVIACRNHADLQYAGGQAPIVHLEADLNGVIAHAERVGQRWAICPSNASATYNVNFFSTRRDLERIDWAAVAAHDFREAKVQDAKQAEFLLYESFPWRLVEVIGTKTEEVADRVKAVLQPADHRPTVARKTSWYFSEKD